MAAPSTTTDLTAASLDAVNGESLRQIATHTLASGARLTDAWDRLEPIVRALIKLVETDIEQHTVADPARLLAQCATVVQKLGIAATGMFKATEGLQKLRLLLAVGTMERTPPTARSNRQLIDVIVGTLQKAHTKGQPCPVCHLVAPLEITTAAVEGEA
jgi:hypothetical protein